jgi:hypothetical protein
MKNKWLYCKLFNFWPSYRGSGGRVIFINKDFKYIKIKIPKNLKTRNYVGTIFGGSMYGAVDPIYMVMLIKILGDKFIVWDKSATIRYLKPATKTLYAEFIVTEELLHAIKSELAEKTKTELDFLIELKDKNGVIYAEVEKRLYFRLKK